MEAIDLDRSLAGALDGRRLLDHPFYRRWTAGEVSMGELSAYAAEYRHFERYLPVFLADLVSSLPQGAARSLVEANLGDELGDSIPHVELFETFASAVGAPAKEPSEATRRLLGTYRQSLQDGPDAALSAFLAYEYQAPDVASSKAAGLREHYGLDESGIEFWSHHSRVDRRHSAWAQRAVEDLAPSEDAVVRSLRESADAWWAFLDEREAESVTVG
jgi:pyrroloquinoline-quinone synthase